MEECQAADPGTVPQALETKDRVGVDKFKEKVERLSVIPWVPWLDSQGVLWLRNNTVPYSILNFAH